MNMEKGSDAYSHHCFVATTIFIFTVKLEVHCVSAMASVEYVNEEVCRRWSRWVRKWVIWWPNVASSWASGSTWSHRCAPHNSRLLLSGCRHLQTRSWWASHPLWSVPTTHLHLHLLRSFHRRHPTTRWSIILLQPTTIQTGTKHGTDSLQPTSIRLCISPKPRYVLAVTKWPANCLMFYFFLFFFSFPGTQ